MPYTNPPRKENRQVIAIIGGIAGGKTTLASKLSELINDSSVLLEPVGEWSESGILDAFYKDPKKLAFGMQMYAFSSRLKNLKYVLETSEKKGPILMDGHICSDRHVFKSVLKEDGCITPEEELIYEQTYRDWEILVPEHKASVYIYLNTDPDVCLLRAQLRDRSEETSLKLDYLKKLHGKFQRLCATLIEEGNTVYIVDGSKDIDEVAKEALDLLNGSLPLGKPENTTNG